MTEKLLLLHLNIKNIKTNIHINFKKSVVFKEPCNQ